MLGIYSAYVFIVDEQMKGNKMKSKLVIAIVSLCFFFKMGTALADDKPALKSESLTRILAWDPIPGDALFYAGKPVQGSINLIIGGAGASLFWYGVIHEIVHTDQGCGNTSDIGNCDFSSVVDAIAIITGGVLYIPALLWDGIGGISGVKNHNEQVRKQASVLSTFQPMLSVTNKGGFVGAQFTF